MENPFDVWERECDLARNSVLNTVAFERQADLAIEAAERLLAVARVLSGDYCASCGGMGNKVYSSTSLWGGGVGGQTLTSGTCDVCWGTGRRSEKGANLRLFRQLLADNNKKK